MHGQGLLSCRGISLSKLIRNSGQCTSSTTESLLGWIQGIQYCSPDFLEANNKGIDIEPQRISVELINIAKAQRYIEPQRISEELINMCKYWAIFFIMGWSVLFDTRIMNHRNVWWADEYVYKNLGFDIEPQKISAELINIAKNTKILSHRISLVSWSIRCFQGPWTLGSINQNRVWWTISI